jgi:hypothetical protein
MSVALSPLLVLPRSSLRISGVTCVHTEEQRSVLQSNGNLFKFVQKCEWWNKMIIPNNVSGDPTTVQVSPYLSSPAHSCICHKTYTNTWMNQWKHCDKICREIHITYLSLGLNSKEAAKWSISIISLPRWTGWILQYNNGKLGKDNLLHYKHGGCFCCIKSNAFEINQNMPSKFTHQSLTFQQRQAATGAI